MSTGDNVTLREYIEKIMEERIKRIEENLSQRMDHGDTALDLQASELSRRLAELNHAHEQQVQDKSSYLPRETAAANEREFHVYQAELNKWRVEVTANISSARGEARAYIVAVTIGLTILELILKYGVK